MRDFLPGIAAVSLITIAASIGCSSDPGGSGGSGSTTTGAGGATSSSAGTGGATSGSTSASSASTTTSASGSGSATSSTTGAGGSASFACTGSEVSFATDVVPLLQKNCSGADGCHKLAVSAAPNAYAFLVGPTGANCVDGRKVVAPKDPKHSYLIDKLTDQDLCDGAPMPKPFGGGAWVPLDPKDVQTIYDWICAGANND